jgi:hypothetical protein
MLRRVFVLGLCGISFGIAPAASLRAEPKGVTMAAIPIYIVALASVGMGCTADHELPNEFARDGGYAGASGVWAFERFGFDNGRTENGAGLSLRGGFRCHPNVAAEFQGDWLRFDSDEPLLEPQVDAGLATLNTRIFPLTSVLIGRIQPYALAGVGVMTVDREIGLALRMGGGIDVYATPNIVVNASATYLAPYSGVARFNAVTLGAGLDYRF